MRAGVLIGVVVAAFAVLPAGADSSLARRQKSAFVHADGALIDVCGGAPCVP